MAMTTERGLEILARLEELTERITALRKENEKGNLSEGELDAGVGEVEKEMEALEKEAADGYHSRQ